MLSFFPSHFAKKAFTAYILALCIVSIMYIRYAMGLIYLIIGLLSVGGFLYGSSALTRKSLYVGERAFSHKLFTVAFITRLIWVIFVYYFYTGQTGVPFEWEAGDSIGYHEEGSEFSTFELTDVFLYYFHIKKAMSDAGYPLYLTLLYKLIGPNIFLTRVIKCILSAFLCVLIYRLSRRSFGVEVGRMAAVFCCLMPNLIYYCGSHHKETEMLFLTVLFLERADYLLRSRNFRIKNFVVVGFLVICLFFFRTVLGAVAFLAFCIGLLLLPQNTTARHKRTILIIVGVLFSVFLAGTTIFDDVLSTWQSKSDNQRLQREQQTYRGNLWAQYATGAVLAPMITIVPFATMVDTGQYEQQVLSGGNFIKNSMGIFVFVALFDLLFKSKQWRQYALLGSFVVGYLVVLAFSAFANSERFHLPVLPFLLVFSAYGVSLTDKKTIHLVDKWFNLVIVMEIAWAFFKLGSRGVFL